MADWDKIRIDFPSITHGESEGKKLVYLDSACQSLRPWRVINSMSRYYIDFGTCSGPRETSNAVAAEIEALLTGAREEAAAFLGALPKEIIWQPNTTYGINLVASSLSRADCPRGLRLNGESEVLTTDSAHHSGLLPFWRLTVDHGVRLRVVPTEDGGAVDLQRIQDSMSRRTKLVSVPWASNITGTVIPVREIARMAHDNDSLILVDGAQYLPHRAVDLKSLDLDFLAFSLHKMCGPAGMGILYGKEELLSEMPPFIIGGETVTEVRYSDSGGDGKVKPVFRDTPGRFEPGLPNFAGIVGAAEGLRYLSDIGMGEIEQQERGLFGRLIEALGSVPQLEMIAPADRRCERVPLASFKLKGRDGAHIPDERIAEWMDMEVPGYKVLIRSGGHEAHPFLARLGVGISSTRASLYFYNNEET